jgi:FAD/FMN-containing dehydrogenase
MELANAFQTWCSLLGEDNVLNATSAQAAYGRCTSGVQRRIAGALRLTSRSQVVPVIRRAHLDRIPIYPISSGHNWGYGTAQPVVNDCVVVDLSHVDRIVEFDAETGVVTLEPGVTQGRLAEFLDRGNHPYLVPVTGAGPECSIVGNALERGYGITPYVDHFHAVMALEAVMADGREYRSALSEAGGIRIDRVFKWGFGPYMDGIFTQSGMGIVVQMSIALARRPQSVKAFFFGLADPGELGPLVTKVQTVIASYPGIVGAINLMNAHRVLAMSVPYPKAEVGAGAVISDELLARLGRANQVMPWTGFGTLYGSPGVVKAVQKEIRALLRPLASRLIFVSPTGARNLVRIATSLPRVVQSRLGRSVQMLQKSLDLVSGRPNETALPLCYWLSGRYPAADTALDPARDGCGISWYAPLVPMIHERVDRYVSLVTAIMRKHRLEPLITLTTLSDRCFDSTVPLLFDPLDETSRNNATECQFELLEAGRKEGFIPYRVGIQTMDWLPRDDVTYWQVVRSIKKTLDPHNIIAPGRYS